MNNTYMLLLFGMLLILYVAAEDLVFVHAEDIAAASLEVSLWAGGAYDGTVLFVTEGV